MIQRHGPQFIDPGGEAVGAEAIVEAGPAAVVGIGGEDGVLEDQIAGGEGESALTPAGDIHQLL